MKIKFKEIERSQCVWYGWTVDRGIKPCLNCKKPTTGNIKNVMTGKRGHLCIACAKIKGLT